MRKPLSQTGFSLPELIIALSVTSILVFAIMNFMTNSLVQSTMTDARATLLQEAQTSLDLANKDIRLSANADQNNRWPDANAPDPSDQYSWQSTSSTLVLATAAQDDDGNILFEDPNKYITEKNNIIFFIKDGTLYKRVLAAPVTGNSATTTCPPEEATSTCPADDKVLLHNVKSFTIDYKDSQGQSVIPTNARAIQLTIELSEEKYGHPITASYTTMMVFRND